MKNKEGFKKEISSKILEIIAIAERYGVSKDFVYAFCYRIGNYDEYGYSWNALDPNEIDELCSVLEVAYDAEQRINSKSPFFDNKNGFGLN